MKKIFKAIINFITAPFRWLLRGIWALLSKTFLGEIFAEDPEDTPILDTIQKATEEPKDFLEALLEHLADLRRHLFRVVIVLVITVAASFYFIEEIKAWLALPIGGTDNLFTTDVTEGIGVIMQISFAGGAAVALPFIAFELLRFIGPGISRRARIMGFFGIPFVTIFFFGGVLFAYYYMLPPALEFLQSFGGFNNEWRPASYFPTITKILFWIGLAFEFPLVTFVLSSMRVLSPAVLRDNWRPAFIILAVVAAIITPTPDPINMGLVMLPLWTLYGLGILMAQLAWRKEKSA